MIATIAYCVLSVIKKSLSFLSVFLIAECMVLLPHSKVTEFEVYIIIFALWSIVCQSLHKRYLINKCKKITVFSCVIICILSITYALDVYLYGDDGIYGTRKTYLYNNIEHIALFSHLFFVSTFINITKCRNGFRDMLYSFRCLSDYSYHFNFI